MGPRTRAAKNGSNARSQSAPATARYSLSDRWALTGRGRLAWRFRIAPPGEVRRPLTPDLSFVRNDQLRGLSYEAAEIPALAPDVAVEILSPGDRTIDVAGENLRVYLAAGTSLVVVVDPKTRTVNLHDHSGRARLTEEDLPEHPALPGFSLALEGTVRSAGVTALGGLVDN